MLPRFNWHWIVALLFTVAAVGLSAYAWSKLPERVPTHWNIKGEVDGFGSKQMPTLITPGMMVVMLLVFAVLPSISPKNYEVDSFRETYLYVMLLTMGLFLYIHAVIMYGTMRYVEGSRAFDMGKPLLGGIFLFFGLLGNVMGKIRRNFYIGVRVPWTLASDRVWNDTHRFAAWTMVSGGIVGFLSVLTGLSIFIPTGILLVSIFSPILYSFLHYKRLEKLGELGINETTSG